eukprot:TRINITY_DN14916_c0_g1_i1.p1 TRINITY_DN14916_c0_g1~~TRINITY_DN14916_c0_g1_i1.p1  ORF type:complete len:158 (+),score=28.49 TRINITY_DN14916_c0_g1_i1:34-474(+)
MGEKLFPLIKHRLETLGLVIENLPNKVTGMFLQLEMFELQQILEDQEALFDKVKEALQVLSINTDEVVRPNNEEILKQLILDATRKFLEDENEDLELAENITDSILETNEADVLRAAVKIESRIRLLIRNVLRTNNNRLSVAELYK